jgi:hypothetical protein
MKGEAKEVAWQKTGNHGANSIPTALRLTVSSVCAP